jgi:hypothetical protein
MARKETLLQRGRRQKHLNATADVLHLTTMCCIKSCRLASWYSLSAACRWEVTAALSHARKAPFLALQIVCRSEELTPSQTFPRLEWLFSFSTLYQRRLDLGIIPLRAVVEEIKAIMLAVCQCTTIIAR